MAKMVSLPDNEKRHFDIGEQALQKGNYASAAAHFEKAYEADQSYAIAQPLAASLNGLKQFHESLNVMLPHYQAFMQTCCAILMRCGVLLLTDKLTLPRHLL